MEKDINTISMKVLFPVCREILHTEIRPIEVKELTRMAVDKIEPGKENIKSEIEDVREKFVYSKKYNVGYIGKPHCLVFLNDFVKTPQRVINFERINIPILLQSASNGAFEAVKRFEFMIDKRNDNKLWKINEAPDSLIKFRIEKFIIEKTVAMYFQNRWSKYYIEPSNDNDYKHFAKDDFRLKINDKIFTVDVATPNKDGNYGNIKGKHPSDFHILAEKKHNGVDLVGFVAGEYFKNTFFSFETLPIKRLVFFLNTLNHCSYSKFTEHSKTPTP